VIKKGVSIVFAVLMVISLTGYAFAAPFLHWEDKPDALRPGNSQGYFIWRDQQGVHIRITTSGKLHVFSGMVRTDGEFKDVFGKTDCHDDYFHVEGRQKRIVFRFTSTGDVAGLDFHVQDGKKLSFSLSMDGEEINPNSIYIGAEGWHPESNKFTIDGERPGYPDDNEGQTIIVFDGPWGSPPGPGPWHHRPWPGW